MLRLNRRMTLVLAVTALAPLASVAQAPAFPSKPITLVVPFPAGGPNDILARAIAERVGPALKQTIIVDNRAGATGNIGAQAVARAACRRFARIALLREPGGSTIPSRARSHPNALRSNT